MTCNLKPKTAAEEVPVHISLWTGLLSALSSVFPVIIQVLTKAKHYRQVSRCAAAPDNKLRLADTRPLVGCTVGRHRVASQLCLCLDTSFGAEVDGGCGQTPSRLSRSSATEPSRGLAMLQEWFSTVRKDNNHDQRKDKECEGSSG